MSLLGPVAVVLLVLAVIAVLAGAVLAAAVLIFMGVQRSPRRSPDRFLAGRPGKGDKVVVCAGASITHGRMSADYVELLARRLVGRGFQVVNAGRNFDLAANLARRLDAVIACRPDFVTVQVGPNDVNASMDPKKAALYTRLKKLPAPPTLEGYRAALTEILARLRRDTSARVAILTTPVMGEELSGPLHARVEEHNAVVREVARELGADVIPLHERHAELVRAEGGARRRRASAEALGARAVLAHTLGRSWTEISARNGFVLMTDGIHLNERGAAILAEMIEEFVTRAIPREARATGRPAPPAAPG